ncbi:MAG: glycosyltransferase family 2 protein [Anaerolineae bacterium]
MTARDTVPRVQVVIPNWNGCHLLFRCLNALSRQTFDDFTITVVDNGSTDGSVAWLREYAPSVWLIANATNRGFAAAVNQGIRTGDSEYVATLNNDTEPEPGWLEALVTAADSDDRVGMCASKMLFADRPHLINSAGICVDPVGIAWDCRGGEPDRSPEEGGPTEVFGPCAGAALYRRTMLDEVGLFDEDFFAYLEDVDLAWRARLAGWRALCVPTARVYHMHSATLGDGSPFKRYLLGRNKIWLIVKNYPMPWFVYYLPLILLYDLSAVLYALIARRDVHSLKGRLAALTGLPKMWRKRRRVQTLRRTSSREWRKTLHPLEPPWKVTRRYQHIRSSAFEALATGISL